MFAAWRDEALALSDRADDTDGIELRETLCDFIENADLGIKLACVDRESFAGDWRAVYLEMFRVDPSSGSRVWRRLDHDGIACAKLDQDMPDACMTEGSLLGEVKHGYYSLLTQDIIDLLSVDEVEDVENSGDDDDDDDDDGDDEGGRLTFGDTETAETDVVHSFEFADRDRIKINSRTATLRTREGSADIALPGSKVALLFDDAAGEFELVRREEVAASGATLLDLSADVDPRLHPALLLRGSPSSKIEGTLLGEFNFAVELPAGIADLRAFAGVWFKERGLPIMCGHAVLAAAAVAEQRPKNQFYLVAVLRAVQGGQTRYNALIYCAEDSATLQIGLGASVP